MKPAFPKEVSWLERRRAAIGIFLAAFATRFIHLCMISQQPSFAPTLSDAHYYDDTAMQILRGSGGFLSRPYFHAPLYSYFLASLYKCFGHDYFAAMFVQIVIGSASCVLIYLLAKRFFDGPAGVLSGLVAAFYGPFVYYDASFALPTLEIFLTLVFMLGFSSSIEKPTVRKFFWTGAVLGLAAIERPTVLAYGALVPFIVFFYLRKDHALKAVLKLIGAFLVGMSLLPFVVTARNYAVSREPIFIAYQGGLNLWIGNNPQANGCVPRVPGMGTQFSFDTLHAFAEYEAGKKLTYSEESRHWMHSALRFMKKHPAAEAKLLLRKAYFFWNGYEIGNNRDVYRIKKESPVLNAMIADKHFGVYFPFGLIGPLSLLGLWDARRRWRKAAFVYVFILVNAAVWTVFFVCSRYRLSVVPYLIPFASYAVWRGYHKIRQKSRLWELEAAMLAVLIVALNLPFAARAAASPAEEAECPQARLYFEAKQYSRALDLYRQAMQDYPFNASYAAGAGEAELALGDKLGARKTFQQALERFGYDRRLKDDLGRVDRSLNPDLYRARALADEGTHLLSDEHDVLGGRRLLEKAIKLYPRDSMIYYAAALSYEFNDQMERYGTGSNLAKAAEYYKKAIELDKDNPYAHYNLACLYDAYGLGSPAEALNEYRENLRLHPSEPEAARTRERIRELESRVAPSLQSTS